MNKTLLILANLLFSLSALAETAVVSAAKAAELACHRIERLVILKKIEATYMDHLVSLKVESLQQNTPNDAKFKVTAWQHPGQDGSANKIEILFGENGRAGLHQTFPGAPSNHSPTWPDKDPVTLMENALHYVLDGENQPELKPFFSGLTTVGLIQEIDNGQPIARVEMHASETSRVLNVYIKADGSFLRSQIQP